MTLDDVRIPGLRSGTWTFSSLCQMFAGILLQWLAATNRSVQQQRQLCELEAWLRANCPKATVNMSEIEAMVGYFTAATRPLCFSRLSRLKLFIKRQPMLIMQQLLTFNGPAVWRLP